MVGDLILTNKILSKLIFLFNRSTFRHTLIKDIDVYETWMQSKKAGFPHTKE